MIHLKDVSYGSPLFRVRDINFHLEEGQTAVILGPRRSGKSSFLKACVGALPLLEGEVEFMGKKISRLDSGFFGERVQDVGLVTQNITLMDNLTIAANIGLPLSYHKGFDDQEMMKTVMPVMKRFGIEDLALKFPYEIPEDKAKLTQIARAVVMQPKILLLDEPTTGDLDPGGFRQISDIIKEFQLSGMTMLIATYSFSLASVIKVKCYYFIDRRLIPHSELAKSPNAKARRYLKEMQDYVELQSEETTGFFQTSDLDKIFEE